MRRGFIISICPMCFIVEPGFSDSTLDGLRALGYHVNCRAKATGATASASRSIRRRAIWKAGRIIGTALGKLRDINRRIL